MKIENPGPIQVKVLRVLHAAYHHRNRPFLTLNHLTRVINEVYPHRILTSESIHSSMSGMVRHRERYWLREITGSSDPYERGYVITKTGIAVIDWLDEPSLKRRAKIVEAHANAEPEFDFDVAPIIKTDNVVELSTLPPKKRRGRKAAMTPEMVEFAAKLLKRQRRADVAIRMGVKVSTLDKYMKIYRKAHGKLKKSA